MDRLELRDVLTVLIGGLVGLLPILMNSILSWFDKRSLAAKQHGALELAKSRVDFIDRWVRVQQILSSAERFEEIKRETASELDQLKMSLSEILADHEQPVQEMTDKRLLQRLLLWYRPGNFSGWVAHIIFYVVLFLTLSLVISYQPGVDLATDTFSWSLLWSDLIFVFIMFIPVLIIRGVAVRIDRKADENLGMSPSAIKS